MDPKSALIEAKELLSDRARWCQGTNAKTADGRHVPPTDPQVVSWCARGALLKVCGLAHPDDSRDLDALGIYRKARELAERCAEVVGGSLVGINDRFGHIDEGDPEELAKRDRAYTEVLSVFDCAIKRADADM